MSAVSREPWLRYKDTGLYAVPSVHYRQVFAQLVYAACWRKRFDVIAVELPPSFGQLGIVEAMLKMAPAPGLVINPTGKTELREVPVNDHPDCTETEVKLVQLGVMHPLTPCDSIVMALRCPHLLAGRHPDWQPEVVLIDDEQRDCERGGGVLPEFDDHEVTARGLDHFYHRMEDGFQVARNIEVDAQREILMGSRLRRYLDQGREILFVCGAAHWRSIQQYLDSGRREDFVPQGGTRRPARLVLTPVNPEIVWLWGWLDDIPQVAWQFEQSCQAGTAGEFDKVSATKRLLGQAAGRALGQGLPVSVRRIAKMERYLRVLCGAASRWLPTLDGQLIPAAESCVERRFAETLKETAMEFPAPLPDGVSPATISNMADGRLAIRSGDETFVVEMATSAGQGTRLPLPVTKPLDAGEKETIKKWPGVYRELPEEQDLHNRLIKRARQLAHRVTRETVTRKFSGGLGQGPAWRQTIRAFAAGERSFYIRDHKRRPRSAGSCDGRCPVVWIFDMHASIDRKFNGIVPAEGHSNKAACYSSFYWIHKTKMLGDTPIQQFHVAYTVSLMRGLMPSRNRTPEVIQALISSFPPERLCHTPPWSDGDLRHLRGYEVAVGCGIKYAGDHVIVVALPTEPLGEAVQAYAAQRGVRIIRVSRDDFEPAALERLALDHNVPAPSHFEPPYEWCKRFIPPF